MAADEVEVTTKQAITPGKRRFITKAPMKRDKKHGKRSAYQIHLFRERMQSIVLK